MHPHAMPLLFLVNLFWCVFWHPNSICPNSLCRNTIFFPGEYLITPAKSNLLNSHRFFFFSSVLSYHWNLYFISYLGACLISPTNYLFKDNSTIALLIIFSHSTQKSVLHVSFLLSIHSEGMSNMAIVFLNLGSKNEK